MEWSVVQKSVQEGVFSESVDISMAVQMDTYMHATLFWLAN